MDPLHIGIALFPLGVYLLIVGAINLRGQPTLLSGGMDTALLAVGCAGLMIAGPLELFMPELAAAKLGGWVWALLAGLYTMSVTLYVLTARPRRVLYNISQSDVRSLLSDVALSLDGEARFAGESLHLPQLGVHLHVERFPMMRNVTLASVGDVQNLSGWRQLDDALRQRLATVRSGANPRGYSLISAALLVLGMASWELIQGQAQLAENLREMLRM